MYVVSYLVCYVGVGLTLMQIADHRFVPLPGTEVKRGVTFLLQIAECLINTMSGYYLTYKHDLLEEKKTEQKYKDTKKKKKYSPRKIL